ncbi:MAG: PH domain-containing protein [Synergistaceae bacterium]|jgi:membrane protein YdbS with pleckstrin-like domain|nr:PH domain-containing protein [Synergistaceae bacterium]
MSRHDSAGILLGEGERMICRTGRHPASLLPFAAIALLLLVPTYGISLILLIPPLVQMKTCSYAVTNKRILVKNGMFGRNLVEIQLGDIFEASIGESPVGARFGMGRIEFRKGQETIRFKEIKNPRAFMSSVMRVRMEASA